MPLKLNLKDAQKLYEEIKEDCLILVKRHAFKDHPERRFTLDEIVMLTREGKTLKLGSLPSAPKESFLIIAKDDGGRHCELGILFEQDEKSGKFIICIHAWRKLK